MKSLTGKFALVLALVVIFAFVAVVLILSQMLSNRENLHLEERGEAQSYLLAESISFAMSHGVIDVSPLEQRLSTADDIDDFRLIARKEITSKPQGDPDDIEQLVFSTGARASRFETAENGTRVYRVSEPIPVIESCLMCHFGIEKGDTAAVTSIFLSTADADRSMRRFILTASLLTFGAAAAILVIVSLTLRLVVIRPILRLNALMADIVEGEGDLTRRVEATKEDEISDVARRINQFIEQIHVIVSNIKGFASSNARLSGSLSASTVQTQNGALTVKSNVDSMQELMADLNQQNSDAATSISEIFANITSLADRIGNQASAVAQASAAIEQMSSSIDNMAKIADQKMISVKELQEVTQIGGQKIEDVNAHIAKISQNIDAIGGMVNLINGVAAQTNLLSMNAAIEAAHAKEFGRGFAVVAEEIRKLAISTSENAKSVAETLKRIIQEISKSQEAAKESSTAFSRIDVEVEEVSDAFSEIANGARELANGGKEVLAASSSLLQITDEIRNGSTEIRFGTEQANNAQTAITDISGHAKENINSIAERTAEITEAIAEITSLSDQAKELGERLNNEVKQFIVRE